MAWKLPTGAGAFATADAPEAPGRFSPSLVAAARRFLLPLVRLLHRPTVSGFEHLPAGPFLLVANHSAGLGLSEIGSFYALYWARFGVSRPLAGFALPLGFRVPPMAKLLRAGGAIPSTYAAAEAALRDGVPILVFPGGDHETTRPLWQAHRVDFGGRQGFLRIARAAGVPIVPMGIRGSHFTAPVLFRARWLATALVAPRLIGQKRWGLSLLGVLVGASIFAFVPAIVAVRVALIWLFLGSPLTFLPWLPWTIRFRIGPPLEPAVLFAGGDRPEAMREALATVEQAVQAGVDGGRRLPRAPQRHGGAG